MRTFDFERPLAQRILKPRKALKEYSRFTSELRTSGQKEPIKDPARFEWHQVKKIEHCRLDLNALSEPLALREDRAGARAVTAVGKKLAASLTEPILHDMSFSPITPRPTRRKARTGLFFSAMPAEPNLPVTTLR